MLDSVERRLEKTLMRYDGETTAPRGMAGKLMAMTNQLMVQKKKLAKVMDNLSEMEINNANGLEEVIEFLGHLLSSENSRLIPGATSDAVQP